MINAEPPPEQPPYPHALKSELQRCYGSKTDTKTLWRAGGWMHQKRVAAAATLAQERGRPFSSTGFEVAPRVIAPERSVLPGEQLATAAVVEKLDSGVLAAVAVERSAANPQLFNDDNDVTKRNVRGTVVDAAAALRRSEAHDAKVRSKYPQVKSPSARRPRHDPRLARAHRSPARPPHARPTLTTSSSTPPPPQVPVRIGGAMAYAPGSQQSSMPTPSAAASLVPMLDAPETETLAERLKRPPAAAPADDDEY